MERTFAMVKPDGVRRGLIGEVISRLEKKGIEIVAIKSMNITRALAEQHYEEHKDKSFFAELVDFIISGPVVALVLQGENVIVKVRNMMGATDPKEAAPGTIRGDLALSIDQNVMHGSDSPASAVREIDLFFSDPRRLS